MGVLLGILPNFFYIIFSFALPFPFLFLCEVYLNICVCVLERDLLWERECVTEYSLCAPVIKRNTVTKWQSIAKIDKYLAILWSSLKLRTERSSLANCKNVESDEFLPQATATARWAANTGRVARFQTDIYLLCMITPTAQQCSILHKTSL